MSDCEQLRNAIQDAKRARNRSIQDNTHAENAGRPPMHSEADILALRLAVDIATNEARDAGCYVDDIAGPHVGNLIDP